MDIAGGAVALPWYEPLGSRLLFKAFRIWYRSCMPVISVFLGIVIRLFHDDHNPPHIHIEYAEAEGIMEIASGKLLAGKLPARVLRLVEEWRLLHKGALQRAWGEAQTGKLPKRIPPLV